MGRRDPDGRWCRPSGRHLPAAWGRARPSDHDPRAVRKGPRLAGWLPDGLAVPLDRAPRGDRRLVEPVPELGDPRSREVGPGRLRLRAGRLPRSGALAGSPRCLVAARDARLLRLHRVGGQPAVVQWQGRPERDLVLRHEPMAGRRPAATPSGRDLRLGGCRRLVPRRHPSRRDLHHLHPGLVRDAGALRPARPRRAGTPEPRHRRAGLRTRDPDRRGAGGQHRGLRRGVVGSPVRRRATGEPGPGSVAHHRAAALGGQLGRQRAAPPR